MSLTVDFDFVELRKFKKELVGELETLMRGSVVSSGIATVYKAKQGKFKDHSGQLRANISSRYVGNRGGWFSVDVVSSMPYASFVNDGTMAHDIWPKAVHNLKGPLRSGQTRRATGKGQHEFIVGRGLALRWKDAAGIAHFAKMVHHPGSKAIPFMDEAREFGKLTFETYFNRGFVGIAERLE